MDWIWEVGKLVLAAGLGFGGGQAAVLLDRRRKKKDELASLKADWEVVHTQGAIYELKNVGSASADRITVEAEGGRVLRDLSPTSLERGGSAAFMFARGNHHSPQLKISWQDHNGVSQGPVSRLVPPMPPAMPNRGSR
jgi:hypothetical protein